MTTRRRCASKRRYPSAGAARHAMRRMVAAGRAAGDLDVYPCTICGGWHWGHRRGALQSRADRTIAAVERAIRQDRERASG